MEKGRQLLAADPESFTDYKIEGTLDPDGYLTPCRIVFRTADGMREQKLGVAGSSGYGGNRGGREASITFDVFGHRTLSVLNIDNEK